jgi:RecA/RadA recombinase
MVDAVRRKLGRQQLIWEPSTYLDTCNADLNTVLGHTERGLAFGRIMEISGRESHGKSALAFNLAALAQQQHQAVIVWADFENSYTVEWAAKRGLNTDEVLVLQPYVAKFGKEKEERLCTGEELCSEVEAVIKTVHKQGADKIMLVLDSVASINLEAVQDAGIEGQNLKTNMELPKFMGQLLRRWTALAQTSNVLMLFINQLRQNPMAMFQDPWYEPGGNALPFHAHVRARVARVGGKKGSRILRSGKQVGIKGVITNRKNKAGGLEGSEVGYKIYFDGPIEFIKAKEAKEGED